MKVRFTADARADLLEAKRFYGTARPALRQAFATEVRRALARIARHPRSGSPFEEDTRRTLLNGFPYSIVYELSSEIVVVALLHHRRAPGGWHDRLPAT